MYQSPVIADHHLRPARPAAWIRDAMRRAVQGHTVEDWAASLLDAVG